MRLLKKSTLSLAFALMASPLMAADYTIDTKGAHASITFKIKHLGYSWLKGRFDDFSGNFSYDPANPDAAKVSVDIDPASVNSNHAERDKHLRGDDFFAVKKFPKATFVSTGFKKGSGKTGTLTGDLTLRGVTRPITINVTEIGGGSDPWGGYRQGFEGTTRFALKDFGIDFNLGPASREVELALSVEGIRQ